MITQYYAPKSMDELHRHLQLLTPDSKIIAGGTDLVIQLNNGKCRPDALLYPGDIPGIREIVREGEIVTIGAMATMTQIAGSGVIRKTMTAVAQSAGHVGSTQIRNKATLGGNIANASPAGDLLPALWLFETVVDIAGPQGMRTLPADQILQGPGKPAIAHNEVIVRFRSKIPGEGEATAYKKLGSRSEVTISRVGVAVRIKWEGGRVCACNVVAGAVATAPVCVPDAARCLQGTELELTAVKAAGEALSAFILDINQRPNRFYKARASKGVLQDALLLLPEAVD